MVAIAEVVGGLVGGVVEHERGDNVGSVWRLLDHLHHAGGVDVEHAAPLMKCKEVVVEDEPHIEVGSAPPSSQQRCDSEPPQGEQRDHGLWSLEERSEPCFIPMQPVDPDFADASQRVCLS